MSAVAAPLGLRVAEHISGDPRFISLVDGILSGLASNIFTGTPVKMNTDGTVIATTTAAADPVFGIFAGCEFTQADGTRRVLPYWPSGQTYVAGSCLAKIVPINDAGAVFIGQGVGSYALINRGEGVNLQNNTQGSVFTGLSSQALSAPTGATAATFTILDLVNQPDNAWGDAFTWVYVTIQTRQGPVA